MRETIRDVVDVYLSKIAIDKYHRYKSWDHCYNAFNTFSDTKYLTIQLGFFLASWGMYRGSGGLLQKNSMIHVGAVNILLLDKNKGLRCRELNEVSLKDIERILFLKKSLIQCYERFRYERGDNEKKISTTDTLLSKIMLGTYGCVPAYDRYFIKGLGEKGLKKSSFNEGSLKELFIFIDENKKEIIEIQQFYLCKNRQYYPIMKIVDMYFWQLGYDKES